MAVDPISADRRRSTRSRKGGLRTGRVCAYCGSLQLSHLIPREIDSDAVAEACPSCHVLLDAAQRDAGVEFRPVPETIPERIIASERARAVVLELIAAGLRQSADAHERFLASLDAAGVEWRNLPGAQP